MATPTVSVILSRPRHEDHLQDALESVRGQSFFDLELIIRDTLQQAIREAQGEYVAFLDSDHLWDSRKLEKQLAKLGANSGLKWCYSDARNRAQPESPLHAGQVLRPLLMNNFIPPSSVVARREVFEALGGMDETGGGASAEWDMWLRLAARYAVDFVPEPLTQLRQQGPDGDIEELYRSQLRVVEAAVARHRSLLSDLRSYALAGICVSAGNSYLEAGNGGEARHKFAEALTHNPLRSDAYLTWASSFLSAEVQQQVRDLQALSRFTQPAPKRHSQPAARP